VLSRITVIVQRAVVVLSALAILLCGLVWPLKVMLLALLVCLSIWQERRQVLRINSVSCERGQWWAVIAGKRVSVTLHGEHVVLVWLVVLHLRDVDSNRVHPVVLWPDAARTDDLRRLRVFLKFSESTV